SLIAPPSHHTHRTPPISLHSFFLTVIPPPPRSTLFPYTTLFRSSSAWTPGSTGPPTVPITRAAGWEKRCSRSPSSSRPISGSRRSEEHTSELQSLRHLVCRLLLEKKKHNNNTKTDAYQNGTLALA